MHAHTHTHIHTHTHTHSFDHDGLGRYGDRLHPDGDLLAMQTVAAVLRDQGLLFLTVPVGEYTALLNSQKGGCSCNLSLPPAVPSDIIVGKVLMWWYGTYIVAMAT